MPLQNARRLRAIGCVHRRDRGLQLEYYSKSYAGAQETLRGPVKSKQPID